MARDNFTYGAIEDGVPAVTFERTKDGKLRITPRGDYEGEEGFTLTPSLAREMANRILKLAERCKKVKKK